MSRNLHWTLLGGCAALISMFTPLAWNSLQVFRLPAGATSVVGAQMQAAALSAESQEIALSATALKQPSGPGRP